MKIMKKINLKEKINSLDKSVGFFIVFVFLSSIILPFAKTFNFFNIYLLLLNLVYIFVLFLIILLFLSNPPFFKQTIKNINFWFLANLLFFLTIIVVSIVWSHNLLATFINGISFAPLILGFFLLISIDHNPVKTFSVLSRVMAILGTTLSVFAFLAILFGEFKVIENMPNDWAFQGFSFGKITIGQAIFSIFSFPRISSLLTNPNIFAAWLVFTLPMTFYCIIVIRKKLLWIFLALLQGLALSLTLSRTGIVTVVIGLSLILCLLIKFNYIKIKSKIVFVFALVILGIIIFLFLFRYTEKTKLHEVLDLAQRDYVWWLPLWQSFKNHPLLGIGFIASLYISSTPHNLFLMVLSDIGLIGLASFLLLWLLPIINIFKKNHLITSSSSRLILIFCFSISVSFMFHQFFEVYMFHANAHSPLLNSFHLLFWLYTLALMVHPVLFIKQPLKESKNHTE